jgi:cytochrome o ubiquinol oxidase subunit II
MKRMAGILITLGVSGFLALLTFLAIQGGLPVLFPSGSIGLAERNLMIQTTLLMFIVAIPVYLITILIIWRYRAKNTHATYTPDWEHSRFEEFVWWIIPLEIVLVLGALTWNATHRLDPEAPLVQETAPYTVQVVALPWKWLFIYPESNIASVNELVIPEDRPIEFQITADAPMNSFWIPALGGQMYAMSGMMTKLHLLAPTPGTFEGRSANYSGDGFGEMTFEVHVVTEEELAAWKEESRLSFETLTPESYASLAKPSSAEPVRYYGTITFGFMDIVHESIGLPPH